MWYQVALFAHITGAILLFIALGLEWLGVSRLSQIQRVEQVRDMSAFLRVMEKLFPISAVLILGGGLYMAAAVWGFALAWLDAALVAVFAMIVLGNVISGRRMAAIGRTAFEEPDGPVSPRLRALTTDPVLLLWSRIGALLGWWIVFLMTLKPALLGTLVSAAVAMALGLALAQMALRTQSARKAEQVETPAYREAAQPTSR